MKKSYSELLDEFNQKNKNRSFSTDKITLRGVKTLDVYNITAPFKDNDKIVIAGRVESRADHYSTVYFFEKKENQYYKINKAPFYKLQDPFYTMINKELVFGGVKIFPVSRQSKKVTWQTIFYRGKNIACLKKFAVGPPAMKDIRLVALANNKIGVFTRPQGSIGGRGKIGYIEIERLEDLSIKNMAKAKLLDQFYAEEWGGVNEAHLLSNGKIGLLSHIACFHNGKKLYASSSFCFDPLTKQYSALKIIAHRALFKKGEAKREDLADVVFSGGLIRHNNGTATLYCGISDAEAHWIEINDPFLEYEQL